MHEKEGYGGEKKPGVRKEKGRETVEGIEKGSPRRENTEEKEGERDGDEKKGSDRKRERESE